MAEWTQEQRSAIQSEPRGYRLTAGAGSGKTTVLVERYLEALRHGLRPRQILAVTFTVEAAHQLKQRIREALERSSEDRLRKLAGEITDSSPLGTIHGFCHRLIARFASEISLPPLDSLLDPFLETLIFAREYERWRRSLPPDSQGTPFPGLTTAELKQSARVLWGPHRHPPLQRTQYFDGLLECLAPLHRALDGATFERGLYRYWDLEAAAHQLLKESPRCAEACAERYRLVLVDEFQDTSPRQWDILKSAVGGDCARFFLVGDPKQSIYGFREADVRLFETVGSEILENGGTWGELTTNFRTEPPLLEALNSVCTPLFDGASIPFRPMVAGRRVEGPRGPAVAFHRYPSPTEEPLRVAEAVDATLQSGVTPDSVALLFRVSDRMESFLTALEGRGIRGSCRQSQSLFDDRELHHLACALRATADPFDDLSVAGFLLSPYGGLSPERMLTLAQSPGSWWERVVRADLLPWWRALIERGETGLHSVLGCLLRESGYAPPPSLRWSRWLEAMQPADLSLYEALERMARWEEEGIAIEAPPARGGVRLMTVHGAKGLEFEHVFLVDCLRGAPKHTPPLLLGPHTGGLKLKSQSASAEGDTYYEALAADRLVREGEEAKRILYVALTRARHQLHLSLPEDLGKIRPGTWAERLLPLLEENEKREEPFRIPPAFPPGSLDDSRAGGEDTEP